MFERTLSEGDLRAEALEALRLVLPSRAGDSWFDGELCQGRGGTMGHDPGPEICHWMLWKLGCRDSRVLNRDVPELRISYSQRGVGRLVLGSQRLAAWRPFTLENSPSPGDVLHLGSIARGEPEHVCVFICSEGRLWRTADVVPCERKGHWKADFVERRLDGFRMVGRTGVTKQLNGWVDLWGALSY